MKFPKLFAYHLVILMFPKNTRIISYSSLLVFSSKVFKFLNNYIYFFTFPCITQIFDFLSMSVLTLLYKNFCYKYNFLSYSKFYEEKCIMLMFQSILIISTIRNIKTNNAVY